MLKKFLFAMCFMGMCFFLNAQNLSEIGGGKVSLNVGIVDETGTHGGDPRSPIVIPSVSLDGHTLYTGAVWFDATLQVLDEDGNVVYTTFVPAGTPTVVLPSTLSGDYELQLIQGYWYFYGYITL